MSEENKALVNRWFEEVWNKGRAEAIDEMFAEDGIVHGLNDDGSEMRGVSGFKPFFQTFRDSFPSMQVVVEDAIAEGDMVAARCRVRGQHQGESLGYAATQQVVEFTGMAIVRIREGKIVEGLEQL